jgi:hypothetical protein
MGEWNGRQRSPQSGFVEVARCTEPAIWEKSAAIPRHNGVIAEESPPSSVPPFST